MRYNPDQNHLGIQIIVLLFLDKKKSTHKHSNSDIQEFAYLFLIETSTQA